jgi:hypothetical protein
MDEQEIAILQYVGDHPGADEEEICRALGLRAMEGRSLLSSMRGRDLLLSKQTVASPHPIYRLTPLGERVREEQ